MMNTKEFNIADDYFSDALIEIDDKKVYEYAIETLLRFLHEDNFSVNDVLDFYGLSDLQDECDIARLMEYLEVTNIPKHHKIIAQNESGYLIINDDE